MGHAVAFDQTRHPRPIRNIGSAVIADHRGTMNHRSSNNQRPCNPSHVSGPEEDIVLLHIEMDKGIMRNLERETAMRMNDTLRRAGCAGREENHKRVLSGHL